MNPAEAAHPETWNLKPLVVLDIGDLTGRRLHEAGYCPKPNADKQNSQSSANVAEPTARLVANRQTPLGGKQPNAVSKVPRHGHDSDDVEGDRPGTLEVEPHFREGVVIAAAHQVYADRQSV